MMSEWTQVPNKERKWELKHNGIVLATIFKKPSHPKMSKAGADKYSLYVVVLLKVYRCLLGSVQDPYV